MPDDFKEHADAAPGSVETQPAPPESPPAQTQRRRAVRRLLRAQTYYAVALSVFALLALFARFNAYFGWDLRVARAVQSLSLPGLTGFMAFVSLFGNGWTPYALAATTVIAFFIFRRQSEAWGVALSAGGSAIVNTLLKLLVARPRPAAVLVTVFDERSSLSFPSGHVTFYVSYFGFLFFVAFALLRPGSFARRSALVLTALPVALVGLSRVYLGAHWPSDALGAYLWSGMWLAFSLYMYRRWKARKLPDAIAHADMETNRA